MGLMAEWKIGGQSEREYTFDVYSVDSVLPDDGGIYILSRREKQEDGTGVHKVLYVGKTESISRNISKTHEKWDAAIQKGMNAISIYLIDNSIRTVVENDLIDKFSPPLNE